MTHKLLGLCLLSALNIVKGKVNDLDVEYIADVVNQSEADAFTYKLPENAYQYKATNETLTDYGTFDYIIVGAGSAGAVLATRLSEDDNLTILLIEAGGSASTAANIPGTMMYQQGSEFNWNYRSVPQKTVCLGMVEHRCLHPRGKGLGGSTIINGLMYVRGNKHDYDSWARAGNRGWSYREVLPYFKKSENSQIHGDPGYHGKGGLLNVEYSEPVSPIFDSYLKANQELGIKTIDINGKEQLGVARTQLNTINGQRDNTGKAFLARASNRANLKILPYSYANKVIINKRKQAEGVMFDYNGHSFSANARKGVILSAGAIGSPQLLMLSGIGPSKHLKSLKIPLVSDLPVGENYQNHATYLGLFFTSNYSVPARTLYENSRDYLNDFGPLTIPWNTQGLGFLRTKSSQTLKSVPNIEIMLMPQIAVTDFDQRGFNFDDETYNTYWTQINPRTTFKVQVVLLKPKSRGTIKLKSANPYDYPLIDPNFLSDKNDEDIEALYEGIKMVLKMVDTNAFKTLDVKYFNAVVPQCRNYTDYSKEQWFCQIRHLTSHLYHPVGTCKMAPKSSKGVVNAELKVHGIEKLYIVDASIIPDVTAGHTSAPVIMIAEKIADALKKK